MQPNSDLTTNSGNEYFSTLEEDGQRSRRSQTRGICWSLGNVCVEFKGCGTSFQGMKLRYHKTHRSSQMVPVCRLPPLHRCRPSSGAHSHCPATAKTAISTSDESSIPRALWLVNALQQISTVEMPTPTFNLVLKFVRLCRASHDMCMDRVCAGVRILRVCWCTDLGYDEEVLAGVALPHDLLSVLELHRLQRVRHRQSLPHVQRLCQ